MFMIYLPYAILAALFAWFVEGLVSAGLFYRPGQRELAPCQKYTGIPGSEDIAALSDGSVFISSVDRHTETPGAIFYKKPGEAPVQLPGDYPEEFFPHGIDVCEDGEIHLFVINHRLQGDWVDVFAFDESSMRLVYQPALSRPLEVNLNDLSVINRHEYVVTRDHWFRGKLGRVEDYLRLPLGRVLHVSPQGVKAVIRGLRFANGIYYSSDAGGRLMVAETLRGSVGSWVWQPGGKAQLLRRVRHLGGVDNITRDPLTRSYIVAAHPNMFKLAKYQRDAARRSPSVVWSLKIDDAACAGEARKIFECESDPLAAISTVVLTRGEFIAGSVFDDGIIVSDREGRNPV